MGAEASHQPGHYREPELPEGVLEVRISVYKLELTGVGFLDHIGAGLAGAYHSGVVVANEEWAFGGHDMEGKSGVYRNKPEFNADYLFYQRVVMGHIRCTPPAVTQIVRQLARSEQWAGPSYDLIERNCNHFASELCWQLLKKRPPEWINSTAESLSLGRRRSKTEATELASALAAYRAEHGVIWPKSSDAGAVQPGADAPGAQAFQDAFSKTFELSWSAGCHKIRLAGEQCPEGTDPAACRSRVEAQQLAAAAAAAQRAARTVAAVARLAAEARASHPEGPGQAAWDAAWARGSAPLLRQWREQAVAGSLDPDPAGEQGRQRAVQVDSALAAAAQAAWAAAEEDEARAARRAAAVAGRGPARPRPANS